MGKIKDIYAGKPDAKDEIETEGLETFLKNYIVPKNFNLAALINGSGFFITGYKGTGKTAILYYLDNYLKELDSMTLSSFIFFKADYTDSKKQEMEILAKRLTSTISIGNDIILKGEDFEYIWRWLFYSRIIKDNQEYNYGLFNNNDNWTSFENKMDHICPDKKSILSIPQKLKLSMPLTDIPSATTITPTLELDFKDEKIQESSSYRAFVQIIDEADEIFRKLERTDIPYFIFVDELEAYLGDEAVFKRDLRLIRDMIFTIKKINLVMSQNKTIKTKIICSVRTEVINAINRFIITKEINKVISGFEVPLIWDYTNTNSYNHPIMQILIQRILYGEDKTGLKLSEKELINKWFPEKINGYNAATYILNNSWCKPRDIVRLIYSAQNCLATDNNSFSQKTIDMSRKRYSKDSLAEIREELRALYSADNIDEIITCLTGFKRVFSLKELQLRVETLYQKSILHIRLYDILKDLYRVGLVGNYMPKAKTYRWQHKGDEEIILDNQWNVIVHSALLSALSVNNRQDSVNKVPCKRVESSVSFLVEQISSFYAKGFIKYSGNKEKACIHISQISNSYVEHIEDYLTVGNEYSAKIIRYDDVYKEWELTLKNKL